MNMFLPHNQAFSKEDKSLAMFIKKNFLFV